MLHHIDLLVSVTAFIQFGSEYIAFMFVWCPLPPVLPHRTYYTGYSSRIHSMQCKYDVPYYLMQFLYHFILLYNLSEFPSIISIAMLVILSPWKSCIFGFVQLFIYKSFCVDTMSLPSILKLVNVHFVSESLLCSIQYITFKVAYWSNCID